MEKDCLFISNRGIAQRCDFYPKVIKSDSKVFEWNNYVKQWKPNEIVTVYVITSNLEQFINTVLKEFENNKQRFVLVTGACVIAVPNELKIKQSKLTKFINNPLLIHWFCQNKSNSSLNSNKLTAIPLGVDYHTLSSGKKIFWDSNKKAIDQEKDILSISNKSPKWDDKKDVCFASYHFVNINKYNNDRNQATKVFKGKKYSIFLNKRTNRKTLLALTGLFKFGISPFGQGLDCHRTWETLIMGSVPIVRKSGICEIFEGLPVIIVNKWEDFDFVKSKKYIYEFFSDSKNENWRDRLTLDFWWGKIHAKCNQEQNPGLVQEVAKSTA